MYRSVANTTTVHLFLDVKLMLHHSALSNLSGVKLI